MSARGRPHARRRQRPRLLRPLLLAAAFAAVFALGVAFGQVTSSDPEPGPAVTTVRTVLPLAAETVTVTTTAPAEP